MLTRYTMKRGVAAAELPPGIRQDTRKHTRHPLRPEKELVARYLEDPSDSAWNEFERSYLAELDKRFVKDRAPYDSLAELAADNDVHLGCNCPTAKNPIAGRCHTYLALEFMSRKYPGLRVVGLS